MILCFSFNANVVPTFFGEYFELVALMGSWAQGISWLKFASVCRLLSFRVKLYLNLAPATAAIIWHTAQRTFMPRLDSPQTFRLRQCSWMKFRPLKLFVHYWKMKGTKIDSRIVKWLPGCDVWCWCWRVSVYNLVRAAVGDTSHAPATAYSAQPSPLSPPEYMMGAGVMTFIFPLRTIYSSRNICY